MKKDTSASSGVLWSGRCQRRSTWPTMFCRYSGNGNSTPSGLTVATSDPVEGVSPGRGAPFGGVRGAASRVVLSAALGGVAADPGLLVGRLALGAAAGRLVRTNARNVARKSS